MKIFWFEGSKNIIGKRLKKARLEHSPPLTQSDLSARLEIKNIIISQKSISKIESGDRFVADYELLAFTQILHVDLVWLLTGKK